jgi:hypothetical protein
MSEEKKGKVKVTLEVEINEELMAAMKDAMAKMPMMMHHGEKKE